MCLGEINSVTAFLNGMICHERDTLAATDSCGISEGFLGGLRPRELNLGYYSWTIDNNAVALPARPFASADPIKPLPDKLEEVHSLSEARC